MGDRAPQNVVDRERKSFWFGFVVWRDLTGVGEEGVGQGHGEAWVEGGRGRSRAGGRLRGVAHPDEGGAGWLLLGLLPALLHCLRVLQEPHPHPLKLHRN